MHFFTKERHAHHPGQNAHDMMWGDPQERAATMWSQSGRGIDWGNPGERFETMIRTSGIRRGINWNLARQKLG